MSVTSLRAAVADLGYELVEAESAVTAGRRVIRLRIDREGGSEPGHGVTTEDCQRVSRALEALLDTAGVDPSYLLEVSSPGIERPVRFAEHWRRYVGRDVRLKARGFAGQVTGRILAVPDAEQVELQVGNQRHAVALSDIKRATLVVDWSTIAGTGKRENR